LSCGSAPTLIGASVLPLGGVAVGADHDAYDNDTDPMIIPTKNTTRFFCDIKFY